MSKIRAVIVDDEDLARQILCEVWKAAHTESREGWRPAIVGIARSSLADFRAEVRLRFKGRSALARDGLSPSQVIQFFI